jgi:hypothetical protein
MRAILAASLVAGLAVADESVEPPWPEHIVFDRIDLRRVFSWSKPLKIEPYFKSHSYPDAFIQPNTFSTTVLYDPRRNVFYLDGPSAVDYQHPPLGPYRGDPRIVLAPRRAPSRPKR